MLAEKKLPQVLRPYNAAEALKVSEAAQLVKRTGPTIRLWCYRHHIGRRVTGTQWEVSRVALAMLVDGDRAALHAYLNGDRTSARVLAYFDRFGIKPAANDDSAIA